MHYNGWYDINPTKPNQTSTLCSLFSSFFFFLLLLISTRSGLHTEIRWSICVSGSQIILCISFSWMDSSLCMNHLVIWSNFNSLHNSQWITFPIQTVLVLYSVWASLLLWHYEGGAPSKRSFFLFWRETKQRPEIEISTRPEVGKGTPERSWKKELREAVDEGRRRGAVDTGQQKRPFGMR